MAEQKSWRKWALVAGNICWEEIEKYKSRNKNLYSTNRLMMLIKYIFIQATNQNGAYALEIIIIFPVSG